EDGALMIGAVLGSGNAVAPVCPTSVPAGGNGDCACAASTPAIASATAVRVIRRSAMFRFPCSCPEAVFRPQCRPLSPLLLPLRRCASFFLEVFGLRIVSLDGLEELAREIAGRGVPLHEFNQRHLGLREACQHGTDLREGLLCRDSLFLRD